MSNDHLKEELARLRQRKSEEAERVQLEKEIKELREEGTFKAKVKASLRTAREHLREKGKKFRDSGDRLSRDRSPEAQESDDRPAIAKMAQESHFGSNAAQKAKETSWESPLSKQLTAPPKKTRK